MQYVPKILTTHMLASSAASRGGQSQLRRPLRVQLDNQRCLDGILGLHFTRAFEDEVNTSSSPPPGVQTACHYQRLPVGKVDSNDESAPELQRSVAELIEDQDAWEHYESDTVASKKQTRRVCLERPGQSDFCYFPDGYGL